MFSSKQPSVYNLFMKNFIVFAMLGLAIVAFAVLRDKESEEGVGQLYHSEKFGIEFSYPDDYFIGFEESFEGERGQNFVVLAEDTLENRRVFAGEEPGREGPPTITVAIYQNNLDNYTARSFVENTNFSNFKLSDGKTTEVIVGGEKGLRYSATGLYENENVVVARPDYVYMFTAFYLTPEDRILSEFDKLLDTIKFDAAVN